MAESKSGIEYFTKEHDMVRRAVKDFMKKEVAPFIEEWEEEGTFPIELYKKAGDVGILGIGFPEEFGGTPGDIFLEIARAEEMVKASGSGGLCSSLSMMSLALPPVLRSGSVEQKEKWIRPCIDGDMIAAMAITEPSGGSDVANLQTTAVKEGDHYVINGNKTFITAGSRADIVLTAVRTGGPGAKGISLFMIEKGTPGFSTSTPLKKMGWWASDTAELYFDNCKVPAENLIGEENMGFYEIMTNFQSERISMAVMAATTAQMAYEEALKYSKEREAFGKKLSGFQVTRHKLVDMATLIEVSREFNYRLAAKLKAGIDVGKET
ncbi:MAG: acyl-CoA dehydrogenase, partial [Desulfobacteraceae bacterium]|nr:acyl-CoA dehydrogenase [Desulfobacteraceae bacterium]